MSGRFRLAVALLLAVLGLSSCAPSAPRLEKGQLDLRGRDWSNGPVTLTGAWASGDGFRPVPDAWQGNDAGGPDGRGSGTYRLTVRVDAGSVPLALRYHTVSTAFSLRVNGTEAVRVGEPDADPLRARSAFSPGSVRLPPAEELTLEFFVSNHVYRTGGLWTAPVLGPVAAVEAARWADESAAVALATALAVIGFSSLVLFAFRTREKTFLFLGVFALLVALRSLVTGEYPLVHMVPGLDFETLIRLEYWSAFLPLPAATMFFAAYFPRVMGRVGLTLLVGPSLVFALLTAVLPLDLLTRAILWYYPFAVPALVTGTVVLVRKIAADRQSVLLLAGVAVLAATALADMASAALFAATGNLVPWGLGLFVALQATTLARRFLAAVEATEALLAEKVLLVQEIHHRVKNSLQVVASLVTLQSNRSQDAGHKAVFGALRNRIAAIALVHEKLYGQGIEGRPDVGDYLRDLLKLQQQGDALAEGLVWTVDAEPVSAEIDLCIDSGLILTELIGNAQRHGRPALGKSHVEVEVSLRDGRLEITVSDDGPGFPPDFRPDACKGLGFRLIQTLLQRNEGSLTVLDGPGGRVRVDLKLPSAAD